MVKIGQRGTLILPTLTPPSEPLVPTVAMGGEKQTNSMQWVQCLRAWPLLYDGIKGRQLHLPMVEILRKVPFFKIRQKYNHISVLRHYCIRTSCCCSSNEYGEPPPPPFQYLSFYNIHNQLSKFDKNPSRFFVYTPMAAFYACSLVKGAFMQRSAEKKSDHIRITTDSSFPLPTPMSRDGFHCIFKHTSLKAWRLLRYGVSPPARVTRAVFWSRIRLLLIPVLFKMLCNELASGLKSNGSFSRAENKV